MRKSGEIFVIAIGVVVVACSSSGGGAGAPGNATPPGATPPGSTPPGGMTNGPIATITLTPPSATVTIGLTQQFTAVGLDAQGRPPFPAPNYTWTVSGGGAIGDSGLFQAGSLVALRDRARELIARDVVVENFRAWGTSPRVGARATAG